MNGRQAAGDRWFRHLCGQRGLDPESTFRELLDTPGAPRPRRPFNPNCLALRLAIIARPNGQSGFNVAARRAAGFDAEELAHLAEPRKR